MFDALLLIVCWFDLEVMPGDFIWPKQNLSRQ